MTRKKRRRPWPPSRYPMVVDDQFAKPRNRSRRARGKRRARYQNLYSPEEQRAWEERTFGEEERR